MPTVACSPAHRNGHSLIPAALLPSTPALAEAACSVNVFFEVAGYGKAQATGRGHSAQEAARNLQATIVATRAALEAPAPLPSREDRLAQLLARGLAKATEKQDWCLIEKLSKAAALVLSDAVSPGEREGMLAVRSQKEPSTWYEVDNGTSCSCPDYAYRKHAGEGVFRCKHILSVLLYARLAEQEAA